MIYEVRKTIPSQIEGKEDKILEWEINDEIVYSLQPLSFRQEADSMRNNDIATFDNCTATYIDEFDRIIITYINHDLEL